MASRFPRLAILLLLSLTTVTQAVIPTQPQIDTARNKGLAWLITHQSGEGAWKVVLDATIADPLPAGAVPPTPDPQGRPG